MWNVSKVPGQFFRITTASNVIFHSNKLNQTPFIKVDI